MNCYFRNVAIFMLLNVSQCVLWGKRYFSFPLKYADKQTTVFTAHLLSIANINNVKIQVCEFLFTFAVVIMWLRIQDVLQNWILKVCFKLILYLNERKCCLWGNTLISLIQHLQFKDNLNINIFSLNTSQIHHTIEVLRHLSCVYARFNAPKGDSLGD